ncbi:alpha/beta fold hydrolase [Mycolicibacterium mengxianglii]|uniref:alpha/beta fold hydrolase n=1 Tax=Mycolicibacterium mengxianglii TaxID=2736649 RepID=UPI0018D01F15|nr:alpha/beta hydrolase [Mycolicibacterium mengxianglii]
MSTTVAAGSLRPTRTSAVAAGDVEITVDHHDCTRPFLVLHGGGGVATVRGFADLLAQRTHSRVLVPTHPGFAGTARPAKLATTRDLAFAYVRLLDELDLADVTVIGNSFGGWVAAEMALLDSPRVSGAVIVDGIGIEVDGHPMADVSGIAPAELAKLSFHDPANAPRPPAGSGSGPSPDVTALTSYAGPTMSDPTLLKRLANLHLPVHVIWGASDGIVDPEYGKAYADAIATSAFTVLPRSGHLPQLETPEELLGAITDLGN